MTSEEKVAQALIDTHKTLAVAESCTGGLLAHRLTNIAGSSKFFKGGVIAYSNTAKIQMLRVPEELIKKRGAVHDDVAMAMAQGIRAIWRTDFGIGITGIAGPTGATQTKPLGLTYIAVATSIDTLCLKCQFTGTRARVKSQAATEAMKLLLEFL